MNSLEDYYKWFDAKARELPYPDRLEVMNTVDTTDHRKMYIELLKLRESGKLPAEWNPVLDNFYASSKAAHRHDSTMSNATHQNMLDDPIPLATCSLG